MTTSTAKLWTAQEAAAFLRMSPSWVYQAAARGVLPTVKLGRALRFDELALRRWLDAQTPRPTVMGLNLRGR